jgi:hypothetical protein
MMTFGRTFEIESAVQSGVKYTFRRLNYAEGARLRMETSRASSAHVREIEKMKAEGASDWEVQMYSSQATIADLVPLTLGRVLKAIEIDGKAIKPEAWLSDPDTSDDVAIEAYTFALKGVRLSAEELGNWLSRGTSSQAEPATATNTDAPIASNSGSMNPATVGDTSPIA